MDTTDHPNSICHVQHIQMYQLPTSETKIPLPFPLLAGEAVVHTGNSVDGLVVLTNYRLYIQLCDSQHHIPLGLIEVVEQRELFYLHIGCKDARTYRCTFDNNENCLEWFSKLLKASAPPRQLEELFAFFHYVWSKEKGGEEMLSKLENQKSLVYDEVAFKNEVDRLKFDIHGVWRISSANKNYKLCPSYPPQLLVPSCITDESLETVAKFRSSRRIPAVVWRHVGNGAVIARCSQPEVGWLGWRCAVDEDLLKAISDACNYDRGPKTMLEMNHSYSPTSQHSEEAVQTDGDINLQEKKKVLIMDARSYTTAVANRARGGGCEYPDYYPSCEIQFMNLANIHSIRKSFHALRQLCMSSADQPNWFSQLEATRWFHHMSGLMRAAVTLVTAVERHARPVLVHCSDGWDRTPQIVALAELLLDPFYRTIDGFRILIEREWLSFGHKFADRCGHTTGSEDQNERCPVFLQWLDCVHQLVKQFPCAFEFSHTFLVKLVHHTYSNLFGTFLCNTKQERMERVNDNTFSVWGFLALPCFKNHLYSAPANGVQVLWPQCNVRDLQLWSEVYLGSLEVQSTNDGNLGSCPGPPGQSPQHMTKTRSYGDLKHAFDACPSQFRRSSDPSITLDIKLSSLQVTSPDLFDAPEGSDQPIIPNPPEFTNGCSTPTQGDFLSSDLTDEVDCNSDCMYKNSEQQSDDDLSEKNVVNDNDENVIFGDKTDVKDKNTDCDKETCSKLNAVSEFESICLKPHSDIAKSDINHNGDVKLDDVDSDTECTEPSESKSENTVCDAPNGLDVERSVETSTETLVSENIICSSSPKEIYGFEKLSSPDNDNNDICKVCQYFNKNSADKQSHHHSGDASGKTSCYSTPPLYSRTSSANGWDSSLNLVQHRNVYHCPLGDDGLVYLRSDMQERLWQLIDSHKRKEEALQKELHTYRQALIRQVCHRCSHSETDKQDDASDSGDSAERSVKSLSPLRMSSPVQRLSSVVDSVCSAGEGQASAVESLRSDMSWEAVEDGSVPLEGNPTLWVPDHAVSRCTGCQTAFWLGRRKHHCRSCGRIFCADCSENSTPLPSEQLYNPVRVCTTCYSKLRRDCGEVPDHCKHNGTQATNNNPQITASSN